MTAEPYQIAAINRDERALSAFYPNSRNNKPKDSHTWQRSGLGFVGL